MEEDKPMEEKSEELTMVERAEAAAAKLEAANKKAEEMHRKHETFFTRQILAGKSEAGVVSVKPPEEAPREYAKRILSGKV